MRRKHRISTEFIYQVFSLVLIVIVVHAAYVGLVRPTADAILGQQALRVESDATYIVERSLFVLIRDYEQEACFILMFWALAIMAFKAQATIRDRAPS